MKLAGAVLAALALWAGPALAQNVIVVPDLKPPDKPPSSGSKPNGGGGTKLPGCATIFVTASPADENGNIWDPVSGYEYPDIVITESTTNTKLVCEAQSLTCSMSITPVTSKLKIVLMDDDLNADDPMGSGSCDIGKTCQLGTNKVTVKKC